MLTEDDDDDDWGITGDEDDESDDEVSRSHSKCPLALPFLPVVLLNSWSAAGFIDAIQGTVKSL